MCFLQEWNSCGVFCLAGPSSYSLVSVADRVFRRRLSANKQHVWRGHSCPRAFLHAAGKRARSSAPQGLIGVAVLPFD